MMYEYEVEYKGYFFSCFSIFNEHYFAFTNSFKAFAPPPCELSLAAPMCAPVKILLAVSFESPPFFLGFITRFQNFTPWNLEDKSRSKLLLYILKK